MHTYIHTYIYIYIYIYINERFLLALSVSGGASYAVLTCDLAFARYCHYQYCMASIAIKACRGGGTILRIRVGNEGGEWGVQTRGYLRLIVLIRIQRPSTKRISCKSQPATARKQHRRFSLDVCMCVYHANTSMCVSYHATMCVYYHAHTHLLLSGSGGAWSARRIRGSA